MRTYLQLLSFHPALLLLHPEKNCSNNESCALLTGNWGKLVGVVSHKSHHLTPVGRLPDGSHRVSISSITQFDHRLVMEPDPSPENDGALDIYLCRSLVKVSLPD
jgi:hypothetical protein